MRDNDAMIKKRSIILTLSYILVVISIITLDQSTKWFFEKHYMLHSSHDSILKYNNDSKLIASLGNITSLKESWVRLDFTYVRNPGAAWGLLGAMNESFRKYFFSIVTVLAIFLIIYLFIKTPIKHKLTRLGYSFIIGGAIGNCIDRLYLNYVIDWIHVEWNIFKWYYSYPVFNIADSFITIGVIFLIGLLVFNVEKEKIRN